MTAAQRKDGLLIREVDGEVLVLDTKADRVHQLNASASVVWRLHQGGAGVSEIARALAAEFDVGNQNVEADVKSVLERFRALNLLS
jgi:hypothetical protein